MICAFTVARIDSIFQLLERFSSEKLSITKSEKLSITKNDIRHIGPWSNMSRIACSGGFVVATALILSTGLRDLTVAAFKALGAGGVWQAQAMPERALIY
jgi:hypothetical protein